VEKDFSGKWVSDRINDISNETALHKNPLAGKNNYIPQPEDFNLFKI